MEGDDFELTVDLTLFLTAPYCNTQAKLDTNKQKIITDNGTNECWSIIITCSINERRCLRTNEWVSLLGQTCKGTVPTADQCLVLTTYVVQCTTPLMWSTMFLYDSSTRAYTEGLHTTLADYQRDCTPLKQEPCYTQVIAMKHPMN